MWVGESCATVCIQRKPVEVWVIIWFMLTGKTTLMSTLLRIQRVAAFRHAHIWNMIFKNYLLIDWQTQMLWLLTQMKKAEGKPRRQDFHTTAGIKSSGNPQPPCQAEVREMDACVLTDLSPVCSHPPCRLCQFGTHTTSQHSDSVGPFYFWAAAV